MKLELDRIDIERKRNMYVSEVAPIFLTKEEAKDKMLEAFDKDLVVGASYFGSYGTRCAIGWLLPEEVAKDIENGMIDFIDTQADRFCSAQKTYVLADELVTSGLLTIEGVTAKQLRSIQHAVDAIDPDRAVELINQL